MKRLNWILLITLSLLLAGVWWFLEQQPTESQQPDYDNYRYAQECKAELGITQDLPVLSCLDGTPVPIYVDHQEIKQSNWSLLSSAKRCDNPHWLGGDQGCWTYSHLQVRHLDQDNILVLNCRQKGDQHEKKWFRQSLSNLGMNQAERKLQYEKAPTAFKKEMYFLYNTFNDIGLILRNIKTGKSCYFTQYGKAVVGFLPPLDKPLPDKETFLSYFNAQQDRPPKDFPESLWYRDANQAFKSPAFTAAAGCVACHNAHGFKYSPYINSKHGLPNIRDMAKLPFLAVGEPFKQFFYEHGIQQITTVPIDGADQLCTRCHKMTSSGTCGYLIDSATNHPDADLSAWLTTSSRHSWMPPEDVDDNLFKKHVAAMKCCCETPKSRGCKTRKFGPTLQDLPQNFNLGQGWIDGTEDALCEAITKSSQWNGFNAQ